MKTLNKKTVNKTAAIGTIVLAGVMSVAVPRSLMAQTAPPQVTYGAAVEKYAGYFDVVHLDSYVAIIDYIRDFVTPEEFAKTFLPIKTSSARAKVMVNAHGPLSSSTQKAMVRLVVSIDQAGGALDVLLSIQAHYQTAIDLLTLQELLKDQLD